MTSTTSTKYMGPREFIALMAMLMSIVVISIDALLPALGVVGRDFSLANPNHAQYVISCLFIGMATGQLVWGPMSDALGRKKVLYFGIVLYFAGSILCYFADIFPMLLAGRLIQGIGVAAPYVTSISIVRDKYVGRDMARIMSVITMIFLIVPALAPSLGQAVMMVTTWRAIFILYLGYALVITLWLYFRMDETLPKERRVPFTPRQVAHGFREVLSNRITASYMVCIGICFGSFMGYLNSSQQIFMVQFGTGGMFTVYFGYLALVMGAASLTNSRIVKRLGMYHISLRAFAAVVVSSALFLALHSVVDTITLWMFMTYATVLFFSFGLVFGNLNAIAMEPMGHIAGIAAAIIGSVSSIISMMLGVFIGQLYDNTLVPMLVGFVLLGSVCIAIMVLAERTRQPENLAP